MTGRTPPALLEERWGAPHALESERTPSSPEIERRRAALLSIPTPREQAAHRRALRDATRPQEAPR